MIRLRYTPPNDDIKGNYIVPYDTAPPNSVDALALVKAGIGRYKASVPSQSELDYITMGGS